MAETKRIVILANSRKAAARCVAGLEIRQRRAHDWIRPVDSSRGTVANYYRTYEDGSEPALGDVVSMSLLRPEGRADHQRENWHLDTSFTWRKDGTLTWNQLRNLPMTDEPLWSDEEAGDSNYGLNNRVRSTRAQSLTSSLRLIPVTDLELHWLRRPRERLDGTFRFGRTTYRLGVTDPVYEQMYYDRPEGSYQIGESLLTISLGEPFAGFCYKLIAGIMEREHYQ